jgi:hypothetical protein
LFFTPHQVYYQCATAAWAEDVVLEPQDFDELLEPFDEQNIEPTARLQPLSPPFPENVHWDHFFQYQDLLQDYIRRKLTHDSDILAAFSGILNSFENDLGPSIFGLPERIFDIVLLWYSDPLATRRPQFPSWSWCGWVIKDCGISWLVVVESLRGRTNAWVRPSKKEQPLSNDGGDVIFEARGSRVMLAGTRGDIVMPQPLKSIRTLTNNLLQFAADTFFDYQYIRDDVAIALDLSLQNNPNKNQPVPKLEFVVMSDSRVSDSWYKRRHGTFALPAAPSISNTFSSLNLMLIKTNELEISERVWVFSVVLESRLPSMVRKIIYLA